MTHSPENNQIDNQDPNGRVLPYDEKTRITGNMTQDLDGELGIDEFKSKYLKSKAAAEGIEEKVRSNHDDIRTVLDESLVKALRAYRGELSGGKRFIYDTAGKLGINLYAIESRRWIQRAKRTLAVMRANSETIDDRIAGEDNPESIAVTVKKREEVARQYARNIVDTRAAIGAYESEIAKREKELKALKSEGLEALSEDRRSDLAFVENEITKLRDYQREMSLTLRRSETKLKIFYQQMKTEQGKLTMAENVSNMNLEVYMNYVTQVESVESLISAGDCGRSFSDIIKLAGASVKDSRSIMKMGNELGYAFSETIQKVNSQADQLRKQSDGEFGYMGMLDISRTKSQIGSDNSVNRILKELLPESYR